MCLGKGLINVLRVWFKKTSLVLMLWTVMGSWDLNVSSEKSSPMAVVNRVIDTKRKTSVTTMVNLVMVFGFLKMVWRSNNANRLAMMKNRLNATKNTPKTLIMWLGHQRIKKGMIITLLLGLILGFLMLLILKPTTRLKKMGMFQQFEGSEEDALQLRMTLVLRERIDGSMI